MVNTFRAQRKSPCASCGDDIEVGDEIARDLEGGYVHLTCPDNLRLERPICPSCFLELPASLICGDCS